MVEYPQFGFEAPVAHHTEYLLGLVKEGKLQPNGNYQCTGLYHDSCYLGRYNEIFDEPRELLGAVGGVRLGEFHRRGSESFCCGAGGGRMWLEELLGRRINEERIDESLQTGADHIFTACPFCMTMYEDGLKSRDREDVKVRDIAEVLIEACRG
jgi:Fe-S oxidoreductase